MEDDLFERLLAAETSEEEMKILLGALPKDLSDAAWASAIPHWFDKRILAALLPHLSKKSDALLGRLRKQAFIESFQGRGYNVHELARGTILTLWWNERREEYRQISARAEAYFAAINDDDSFVEVAYHSLVSTELDLSRVASQWSQIASRLKSTRQFSLAHTLVQNAREHIKGGRVSDSLEKLVSEWERSFAEGLETLAKERHKEGDLAGEAEIYTHIRPLYSDLGDRQAEAGILINLGKTYRRQKLHEEASEQLEQALNMYLSQGNNLGAAKAFAGLGDVQWAKNHLEEALRNYEQGLELDSSSAECLGGRGEIYRLQNKIKEALADFNRAVELDPEDAWAIASRGQVYQSMEQYEEALADFSRLVELDPEDDWAIASRGETYRMMKRYEAALPDFNRAVELDPEAAWAIAHRGETYRLMEQYEAALADFNRALELDPEDAKAIASRGQVYQSMEQYEEALTDFNRALELDATMAWAIASRGETYRMMKRFEEALPDFNRAVELDPKDAWAITCRGEIYRMMKRYEAALADFNQALELEYSDWSLYNRALVFHAINQPENTKADFAAAIDLAILNYSKDSRDWRNTLNLALYYLASGNSKEAELLYRDALACEAGKSNIQHAVQDLDDFFLLFPNHTFAKSIWKLLTDYLQVQARE